jgi:hypothetical protein
MAGAAFAAAGAAAACLCWQILKMASSLQSPMKLHKPNLQLLSECNRRNEGQIAAVEAQILKTSLA